MTDEGRWGENNGSPTSLKIPYRKRGNEKNGEKSDSRRNGEPAQAKEGIGVQPFLIWIGEKKRKKKEVPKKSCGAHRRNGGTSQ